MALLLAGVRARMAGKRASAGHSSRGGSSRRRLHNRMGMGQPYAQPSTKPDPSKTVPVAPHGTGMAGAAPGSKMAPGVPAAGAREAIHSKTMGGR